MPDSRPVTLTVATLVMPSAVLLPLSTAKPKPGKVGATVSTVNVFAPEAMLVLPAASVVVAVTL